LLTLNGPHPTLPLVAEAWKWDWCRMRPFDPENKIHGEGSQKNERNWDQEGFIEEREKINRPLGHTEKTSHFVNCCSRLRLAIAGPAKYDMGTTKLQRGRASPGLQQPIA